MYCDDSNNCHKLLKDQLSAQCEKGQNVLTGENWTKSKLLRHLKMMEYSQRQYNNMNNYLSVSPLQSRKQVTVFPLYFGIEIPGLSVFQGLSRNLKLHLQGPLLDESLQHGQYYSNI